MLLLALAQSLEVEEERMEVRMEAHTAAEIISVELGMG